MCFHALLFTDEVVRPVERLSCNLNQTDCDVTHQEDEVKQHLPQQCRPVDECLAIFKDPKVIHHNTRILPDF